MAIQYHIYGNDGAGGPVNYAAPVASVSGLTWNTPTLAPGGSYTFAVHPYDDVTGFEDRTADSRVSIVLDAGGLDTAGLPVPPLFVAVKPLSGGTARLVWYYPPGLSVSGFHVYSWPTSGPANWASPVGSVGGTSQGNDGSSHARPFSFLLTGLSDGVAYAVGVRGYNASGEGQNTDTVNVTGRTSGPLAVVSLTAAVMP
jgi:hypothetical protein